VEALMLQDMPAVMLLFDDINNKGFEGDTFLNGGIEHFRNLLMCKDVRVARLLDLPDNVKARYYHQANQVSEAYIINAISVFNQSEQLFKQSRNKRMHVELALIKLNYLQQAVQLLSQEDGELLKKKS
jgi:DNA polymerase-3 subunit gamma/tau